MLGFILSKLNLLIMVTAIFAIVTYFTFFVGETAVSQQAQQTLERFVEVTRDAIKSPTLCHRVSIGIPPFIYSLASGQPNNRIFFKVKISKIAGNPSASPPVPSELIFAMVRSFDNKVLAAQRFGTTAEIKLYDWKANIPDALPEAAAGIPIELDPQSAPNPTDSMWIIKETFEGNDFLYVVPCSSGGGICGANFEKLLRSVRNSRTPQVFNCEPPD